MNKKKSLLLVLLSFIAVFALAFSFGCKDNGNEENNGTTDDDVLSGNYEDEGDEKTEPADDWVLQSIALDVSGVKTEYAYGEEFDSSKKPAVSAKFASVESLIKYEETKFLVTGAAEPEYKTETVTDVKVDYGQYNKNAVGTYNIYVSYTHAGVTRAASYPVKVTGSDPAIGGITVELNANHESYDNGSLVYYIASTDGVNVDITGAYSVYAVDGELNKGEEEITEGITLTYYKEGTQIENLNGLQKGTYTIYVNYNNSSAFFVVEVLDPVASIALKPETGVFTQVQSPVEEMTSTWVFVVTYQSGLTAEVKKGDAGLIIGNIITVLPAEGNVTAVYTEGSENASVSVPYAVTENSNLLNEKLEFNREALGLTSGDTNLTQDHLTGDNSFLKKGKGSNAVLRYRAGTDSGCLEIRYDALDIEYYGFGTLMVSARSTGSSNKSAVALKNSEGKYISAVYDVTDVNIKEGTTKDGNVYMVSGDMQKRPAPTPEDPNKTETIPYTARILTFIVPEAGVYTLCTVDAVDVEGETAPIATNRNTRVYKIEKTDVFDNTVDRVSYAFDIDASGVKTDYIAGETQLDKTGLTATFDEIHSVDTDKNKTTNLTADDLKVELTSGDLSKLNTKATVTVTYTANGTDYTKTYTINVKSPVTGVNAVALTKEASSYEQETENGTVTISKEDIVLHKNDKTGDVITLGAGESVEYKLFNGEEELQSWEVADGTYTIKAIIVLNNTEAAVPGTTEFEASINVTVKKWVDPSTKPTEPKTIILSADDLEVQGIAGGGTLAWGEVGLLIGHATTADKIKVEASGKQLVGEAASITTTNRVSIGGGVQNNGGQTLKLTLNEPCTVTLYVASSTASRKINLYNDSKTAIEGSTEVTLSETKNTVTEETFSITQEMITAQSGIFYLGGDGAFYIYYIKITTSGSTTPTVPQNVTLSADDLEVQGVAGGGTLAWGEVAELIGHKDTADKIKVEASGRQLVGDAASITTTNRINIGGSVQSNGCQTVKLTLNAPCAIKVYVTAGSGGRKVNLYNASKTALDAEKAFTIAEATTADATHVYEATFEVTQEMLTAQSNVLYLGADGSFHIYYMTINYAA